MKWSFAALGMFLLGLIGVMAIILFQRLTTSNENDYYLLKEITEAAMWDSFDIEEYKKTGEITIVKEKFVENFTRRYSESTLFIGKNYIITFYDIMEKPPKVTIFINTGIQDFPIFSKGVTDPDYSVQNTLTGIFESIGEKTTTASSINELYDEGSRTVDYYAVVQNVSGGINFNEKLKTPLYLKANNVKDVILQINSYQTVSPGSASSGEVGKIQEAILLREIDWDVGTNTTKYDGVISDKTYADSISISSGPTVLCGKSPRTCNPAGESDEDDKTYWINWSGSISPEVNNAVLRINATWKYKEYKYKTSG